MNCPNCGKEINDTAAFCPFCGQNVETDETKQGEEKLTNPSPENKGDGFKLTASIVLAGISLLLLFIIPGLGIATSVAGIICGIVGRKNPEKKKWSRIGMIASICLLVLCLFRCVLGSSTSQVENSGKSTNSETVASNQGYAGHKNASKGEPSFYAETKDNKVASNDEARNLDAFTIMVYIVGSDLESGGDKGIKYGGAATEDINEITNASWGENVNVILETGGAEKWANDIVSAESLQRYELRDGYLLNKQDLPLERMSTSKALSEFIKWGATNYPAERYGLILWDHGGGMLWGYGVDELFERKSMSISDISAALKNAGIHFDFVGYDACLMASFEMAYALKDYSDYLIASEESESGIGWYYTNWIDALGKEPNMPMEELGRTLINSMIDENQNMREYFKSKGEDYKKQSTLSLIDLSKLDEVYSAWSSYLEKLSKDLDDGGFSDQSQARVRARTYGNSESIDPNTNEIIQSHSDMLDMLDFIDETALPGSFDIKESIRKSIVYCNADISGSNGLSVYMPYYMPSYYKTVGVRELHAIGFDDKYCSYYDKFYSCLATGNPNIDNTGSDSALISNTVLPNHLEVTNDSENNVIELSKEENSLISMVQVEGGLVKESKDSRGNKQYWFFSTGLDEIEPNYTEKGDLIVDWDGKCMFFSTESTSFHDTDRNSRILKPYYYVYESGILENGTKYDIRSVPAVLNDSTPISILVITYYYDDKTTDEVAVGYIVNNAEDIGRKTIYSLNKGDTLSFYAYYYDSSEENNTLHEKNDSVWQEIKVGDHGLFVGYINRDKTVGDTQYDFRYAYRYKITDIYQNDHYTDWFYY